MRFIRCLLTALAYDRWLWGVLALSWMVTCLCWKTSGQQSGPQNPGVILYVLPTFTAQVTRKVITVQSWTFVAPYIPCPCALIPVLTVHLCWKWTRAQWPSRTPTGTKDKDRENKREGGIGQNMKLDNGKSFCENQWSRKMIVIRNSTWPLLFALFVGLILPHTLKWPLKPW